MCVVVWYGNLSRDYASALDLIGNAPVIVLVLVLHMKFYPVASRCLSPLL